MLKIQKKYMYWKFTIELLNSIMNVEQHLISLNNSTAFASIITTWKWIPFMLNRSFIMCVYMKEQKEDTQGVTFTIFETHLIDTKKKIVGFWRI